jgi:hypothetical protein
VAAARSNLFMGFASKSIKRGNEFRVVRVISWIVSVRSGNKDDPRNHTKQHERNTSDQRAKSGF